MLLQHTAPAATTAQLLLVLRPPSRLPAHRHRQPKRAGMAQCRPAAAAATGSDAAAAAADGDRDGSSGSKQATPAWPALRRVLFNAPNSVGWVRLGLLLAAVQQAGRVPKVAAWLFVANMLLDAADGWLARTLQQVRTCTGCQQLHSNVMHNTVPVAACAATSHARAGDGIWCRA